MSELKVISGEEFMAMFRKQEVIDGYEVENLFIDGSGEQLLRGQKSIKNCLFKGSTTFKHFTFSSHVIRLLFTNCRFVVNEKENNLLLFEKLETGWLDINKDCIIQTNLKIQNCGLKTLSINSEITGHTQINSPRIEGMNFAGLSDSRLKLGPVTITGNKAKDTKMEYINFTNVEMTGNLSFMFTPPKSVFIGSGQFNWVQFQNTTDVGIVTITSQSNNMDDLSIKKLSMPYLQLKGSILVKFASIEELTFDHLINVSGSIRLLGIDITKKMILTDSELSNLKFNDVDISRAKVTFDRSNLDGMSFSNVSWRKDYKVYSTTEVLDNHENDNDVKGYKAKRETYRQLKQLHKNQGNRIDALNFYRNEMDSYWLSTKKSSSVGISDKILVGINRFVSDFGQSWWRPLWLIFAVNMFFFSVMLLFHYKGLGITLDPENMSADAFKRCVAEFFYLINPVHKFPEGMGLFVVVDFINRVIIGFLIYHFIKATRRYATI